LSDKHAVVVVIICFAVDGDKFVLNLVLYYDGLVNYMFLLMAVARCNWFAYYCLFVVD